MLACAICCSPVIDGEKHNLQDCINALEEKGEWGNGDKRMSEQATIYTTNATRTTAAILEITEREFWEKKHAEVTRMSNFLCENWKFSRAGYVKGEPVPVKKLRQIVDKTA